MRYNLSVLLAAIAVVGACLAWIAGRVAIALQQNRMEHRLTEAGATVYRSSDVTGSNWRAYCRFLGYDPIRAVDVHCDDAMRIAADCIGIRAVNIVRNRRSGVGVTDEGLKYFGLMLGVQSLFVFDSEASDDGLKHLRNVESLIEVRLIGQQFTDSGMCYLAEVRGLRALEVHSRLITSRGVNHLRGHGNLESLSLWGAMLDIEGIRSIATIPRLKRLQLVNTKLNADALLPIARSETLENLYLVNLACSEKEAMAIGQRMRNCRIHYSCGETE
jgi:hypothetical protein